MICGKFSFADDAGAEKTAFSLAKRGRAGHHLCVYWCAPCGGYHWGNVFGRVGTQKANADSQTLKSDSQTCHSTEGD
jgi:hypothetical protein